MTFKIKDEESINTSTSGNTVKTSNYRSRSKAKKSRAKSKSSNQVKSEDHHKKKKNDNYQNGPSDLIERLRRITMKYDKKEEEGGETGDTAFAEKQATDDSTGGNAPPTSEKEVDISDNEKVKAEAKLSLTDFPESKDEPSRLPTTGISTSIRPSESWDDSASQTSSQVAINSKASEKKSIGLLQKKKKEAKLGSIGDESPTTAEKSVSEIQPVKSDSSSVPTDKLVGSEPIKSANSDDSIKTEIVTKTEKRGESVEEKVTPEDDDSEIDNIAAAYTAVDVIESAELNNAEEGADSAKTGTKDKSGGVLNHIGLFPKPIEEKGLHEERQDGVLFFNPGVYGMIVNKLSNLLRCSHWYFHLSDEINVQHYVTDSEHEGFDGVLLNLNSPKLVDGYGDDSSTQPSTDIFCNEGEINDAMESVNANVHDFCRDELACDAGGPISSFRSLFRRIYPNANLAPVSSFESKDIIMSQHSDTSSLTQEKFTGLNLELNLDGTKQVADENCTQNTPW